MKAGELRVVEEQKGCATKSAAEQGGDWTDKEIARFMNRVERLQNEGLNEMEAEALAQTMLYRDRPMSGDDRRLCLECEHIKGAFCKASKGSYVGAKANLQVVRTVLQRCDLFALRSAKTKTKQQLETTK